MLGPSWASPFGPAAPSKIVPDDFVPAATKLMSAEIADGGLAGRSRQKSRLLPAATKAMSAEIAAGDFGQ
jgi:hypothetical protein